MYFKLRIQRGSQLTGYAISRKLKLNDITKIRRTDMIGIIGAMEEEVSQLIEAMEQKEKVTRAGMDFYCGNLN